MQCERVLITAVVHFYEIDLAAIAAAATITRHERAIRRHDTRNIIA